MMTKYNIFDDSAFAARNGIVGDEIGMVSYIIRNYKDIRLANLVNKENKNFHTPRSAPFMENKIKRTKNHNPKCFYDTFSKESVYRDSKKEIITGKSSNVYKIRINANLSILEVRNNDPLYIIGLDTPKYFILKSIAIHQSEVNDIRQINNANFIENTPVYFFLILINGNKANKQTNPGERTYYHLNLGVSGSKTINGKPEPHQVDTGITLYSFDTNNWFSAKYSDAAFDKIDGYVWNNKIVPEPVGTNPFAAYWSNGSTGLKERLNAIITEANNLPAANDNKGFRLLEDTPIRDYIYQGDIEKVTFEMAFRLPFFIEDMTQTPYTKIDGRDNNPYYTKFDAWFGYANGLRSLAGKTLLNEVGKKVTDYGTAFNDYNREFQDLLLITPQSRKDYFVEKHVPAYIAKNFEYENPGKYVSTAHIPYPVGSIKKLGANARDLTTLVNSEIISQDTKTKLEKGDVRYAKITDGTYDNEEIKNAYVAKSTDKNDNKFYIYVYSWNETSNKPNSSGLTFGFGYDIGKNKKLADFNDYIGSNITADSGVKYTAVMGALGATRMNAMHNYFTYYDSVWKDKDLQISFERAVEKTMPKMKSDSYLRGAIKFLAKNHISNNVKTSELLLRIFQPTFGYFFDEGNVNQFLNEVEKVVLLSLSWNMGNGSVNQNKEPAKDKAGNILLDENGDILLDYPNIARRAIHAFNTHDYRYLKYAVLKSKISHRGEILKLLKEYTTYNYCRQ